MAIRLAKVALVAALALQMTVIVLNNITDYGANYQFVKHVLSMDTTFRSGETAWRALPSPSAWRAFYIGIIVWEAVAAVLLWLGAAACFRARNGSSDDFARSKTIAVIGLTVGLLLWMVAFNTVGGEWFQMWQSQTWNGLNAALRQFTIMGVVTIFLCQSEATFRVQRRSRRRRSSSSAAETAEVVEAAE